MKNSTSNTTLDHFLSHGWKESDLILVECGKAKCLVVDNITSDILEKLCVENGGMIHFESLYKKRGKLGWYRFRGGISAKDSSMIKVDDYRHIIGNSVSECAKHLI